MTTLEQGEIEKTAAEQLIAESPLFNGLESVRVELGEDNTGDPSMWVVFRLRSGFNADESWVKDYSKYSSALRRKLLDSGQKRFPYTRIEPAT